MVRRQRVAIFLLLAICASCKPVAELHKKPAAPVPTMRATVVTIRTVIQPGNKTLDHTIVIANGRARSGDELDRWRLFDLTNGRVTFVDDVNKTFRTSPLSDLIDDRRSALSESLTAPVPRAEIAAARAAKSIQGVIAREWVVRLGGYTHELWIAEHPAIPSQLYAMMIVSRPPSSPMEPVMGAVDETLMNTKGFPLEEHSELPYGNKKMVVDKSVVSIEQRDVPVWWLNISAGYTDVTPPPATKPGGSRRPAS